MSRILILIVLASLAVTAAGCGSTPATPSVAAIGSTTTTSSQGGASPPTGASKAEDVTRFSACMRSHGVPKFPDPKPASGGGMNLTIGPGSGIDPRSAAFQAAQKTCQKLLPNGGKANPADQAKAQAQLLKFSACMRSHGLPDFPDPKISGGGIQMSIGKGLDPNSPVFQAAQKACQSMMPGPKNGSGGNAQLRSGGPSTSSAGSP
jgi:hypothetical protein